MTHKDHRLAELDALRGIAAMCVVLFHFTSKFREDFGYHFTSKFDWNFGHYGVELFFVISGFVIFMTLHKVKSALDFAFKRFSRLYPSYWICIVLTASAIVIFGLPGKEVTLKQVLLNFTMIQGLFKVANVDGSYWSLLPEILFYFMMGFIFRFGMLKWIRVIGMVWLALIVINKFHHLEPFNTLLNLRYGMLFFAGILFYKLKFENDKPLINHLLLLLCGLSALIVNFSVEYIVVITVVFTVFYLFVYNKLSPVANRPLLFLGYISYPLYLIHQYIGYIVIIKLRQVHVNEVACIAVALIVAILLAWFITRVLEKPILEFLRKVGNTKRHQVVTTANE